MLSERLPIYPSPFHVQLSGVKDEECPPCWSGDVIGLGRVAGVCYEPMFCPEYRRGAGGDGGGAAGASQPNDGLIVAAPGSVVVVQQMVFPTTNAATPTPKTATIRAEQFVAAHQGQVLLRGAHKIAVDKGKEGIWKVANWYDDLDDNLSFSQYSNKGPGKGSICWIPKTKIVAIIFDDEAIPLVAPDMGDRIVNACVTYQSDDGTKLTTNRGQLLAKDGKTPIVFKFSMGPGSIHRPRGKALAMMEMSKPFISQARNNNLYRRYSNVRDRQEGRKVLPYGDQKNLPWSFNV